MDNAFIIDSAIVLILLAGAAIGAKRGLIKSLMGVFVVVGALVGTVMLANMLTDPIADSISVKVEEKVVQKFADELEKLDSGSADSGDGAVSKLFEKYGLPTEALDELRNTAADAFKGAKELAVEKSAEEFRGMISAGVRRVVHGTVETVILLVGFLVLVVLLELVAKMLDRVFDLPLLDLTNGVGGAMMGLLEAAVVVFVIVFFATHLGVKEIAENADNSRLLPYFMLRKSFGILPTLNG